MDKVLKSAVNYTFGSGASSRSNGKSKNSKSNKGDSKATREFIEKEIINTQTAKEIEEINQLTAYGESDGQSYGTSEEENVLSGDETCQQQCGQEKSLVQQSTEVDVVMSSIGEACYPQVVQSTKPIEVSQQSTVTASEENEAGFICAESEMDGQSVEDVVEESKILKQSKSVEETKVTQKTSIVSQESQKVSQTIDEIVKICGDSEDAKIVQEIETVAKTVDVSQQSQQKSQSINAVGAKTVDVSEQSQEKSQSISAVVAPCYAAEPIVKSIEIIDEQSTTATKSEKSFCAVDTVNAAMELVHSSKQSQEKSHSISAVPPRFSTGVMDTVGVIEQSTTVTKSRKSVDTVDGAVEQVDSCKCCENGVVCENETQKETSQSLTTKITEIHQDSCKKLAVEKCHESIETKTKLTSHVEMSLEAKSKFSATIEEDSEVLITAKFVNPLSTPLTHGKFWIEADNLGKPYCFEIPHINAGETVICRALIFPRCAGYEFIVARFVSREIKRIIGFTNIRVSHAAPCESTNKVFVPKIANEKVVGCKKM